MTISTRRLQVRDRKTLHGAAMICAEAWNSAGRNLDREKFVSFVDTKEPLYICWCLHKWSQQSSGKQRFRDAFSRMTVPKGRDGSLLGFAFEN